jgi:hypothetical protein
MPIWNLTRVWEGQDAILIGGGPSLKGFDFEWLKGRNVIGCNDAYRLGPDIITLCLFGDACWFTGNKFLIDSSFAKFPSPSGLPRVVTCSQSLGQQTHIPWLYCVGREKMGLHDGNKIGWNFSTGAAAINLAINLGASRIFLLGYDLGNDPKGHPHWHNHNDKPVKEFSYKRFQAGFGEINRDLPKYPNVKVINVSDGSSKLAFFPTITHEAFRRYIPPQLRTHCVECEKRAAIAAQLQQRQAA